MNQVIPPSAEVVAMEKNELTKEWSEYRKKVTRFHKKVFISFVAVYVAFGGFMVTGAMRLNSELAEKKGIEVSAVGQALMAGLIIVAALICGSIVAMMFHQLFQEEQEKIDQEILEI